jgi:hypothetical protein
MKISLPLVTITVEDNKTCTVALSGPHYRDCTVRGLSPEQAVAVQALARNCARSATYFALDAVRAQAQNWEFENSAA